jgi:hypothetical protein
MVGVPAGLAFWLMTSPRFRLQSVTVHGAARVEAAWVVAAVGALRGRPLLLVSLADVEERLARHPWVAGAAIHKDLPSSLTVAIEERRPAGLAAFAGGWTWIDRQGRPIAALRPDEAAEGSLRFTGRVERPSWVAAALEAAERLRRRGPAWAREVEQFEVLGPEDLAFTPQGLPFRVLVAAGRVEEGTAALTRHLPEILAHIEGAEAVDLRFDRQIVIRGAKQPRPEAADVPEA